MISHHVIKGFLPEGISMNFLQSHSLKKTSFLRDFHVSSPTFRFATAESRRKQSRKNWRTLAKSLGLNPNMGNATIKKEAQIMGKLPGCQYMLDQWALQKTVTLEERFVKITKLGNTY